LLRITSRFADLANHQVPDDAYPAPKLTTMSPSRKTGPRPSKERGRPKTTFLSQADVPHLNQRGLAAH
ncbi:hypothetical protein NPIL_105361, partial [Nephila pilipes]